MSALLSVISLCGFSCIGFIFDTFLCDCSCIGVIFGYSLPGASLCCFKYFDQPDFGFSACVALAIAMVSSAASASLWLSAPFMASDTSASLPVVSLRFIFSYQLGQLRLHFRLSACAASSLSATLLVIQLSGVSYISFTFGYQPMWLQLYRLHF